MKELVEKVMVLKKAVERERRLMVESGSNALAEKLRYYILIVNNFEIIMSFVATNQYNYVWKKLKIL